MGTAISVELWADDSRHGVSACAAVMEEMYRVDRRMSPHKESSELSRINREAGRVWLLQPMTFMNRSGKAVAPLARFFKIEPKQILVVHDELDLPPGQMRLKQGGGVAGHNGLKDIRAQLGSADYWRLRLGIGHPGVKSEVAHWVLKKPSLDHRIAIDQCIDRTLKAVPAMLAGEMDKATLVVHTHKAPRPKPPRPASVENTAGESKP